MTEFEPIGSKIRAARKALGYTQKELAQKMAYTESGISRVEKGEIDLPISKIKLFSSVLRVPVDYLIGDYLVESTETPEEQFNRLDADVREELIAEMLDIMKKKEAEKWQQLNGTGKGGE
jgi:transcriptional regulator with XRE-family HTH domain